jgi:hypothetical protein
MMAKRASGKRAEAEKTARPRRKVRAPSTRTPVRRTARRAAAGERVEPVVVDAPVAAPEPVPSAARVAVDDVLVDADEPRFERNQLRALVSVRRGDQVVYTEHVNLDWPGGREKFLRKATRALGAAGIATRIGEALLEELRALARVRAAAAPRVS